MLWLSWILLVVGFLGGFLLAYLIYLVRDPRDRVE